MNPNSPQDPMQTPQPNPTPAQPNLTPEVPLPTPPITPEPQATPVNPFSPIEPINPFQTTPNDTPAPTPTPPLPETPTKKPFPKKLVFIILGIVVLIGIVIAAITFIPSFSGSSINSNSAKSGLVTQSGNGYSIDLPEGYTKQPSQYTDEYFQDKGWEQSTIDLTKELEGENWQNSDGKSTINVRVGRDVGERTFEDLEKQWKEGFESLSESIIDGDDGEVLYKDRLSETIEVSSGKAVLLTNSVYKDDVLLRYRVAGNYLLGTKMSFVSMKIDTNDSSLKESAKTIIQSLKLNS